MLYTGRKALGRIAAFVNHRFIRIYHENSGFLGFFDCIDNDEVAHILFNQAIDFVKEAGANKIFGPASFTQNDKYYGLLIDNFSQRPGVGTQYNKPYYQELFEKNGFKKAKDLLSFIFPILKKESMSTKYETRINQINRHLNLCEKHGIVVRKLNLNCFNEELHMAIGVYNQAFKGIWGFIPIDDWEIDALDRKSFEFYFDPDLYLIALKDNKPIGMIGCLRDINQINFNRTRCYSYTDFYRKYLIKKNFFNIKRVRLFVIAVLREYRKYGIASALICKSFLNARKKNYYECEVSWILEDNLPSNRLTLAMGATINRRWRIFKRDI